MSFRSVVHAQDPSVLAAIKVMSGKRIEDKRRRERITQEEFAARIGIGERWLREIESGNPKCTLDDHFRCAHELGLSTGHLWIPLLFLEHGMIFPKQLLLDDLGQLEQLCIDLIARHNLDALSSQLLPRNARVPTDLGA